MKLNTNYFQICPTIGFFLFFTNERPQTSDLYELKPFKNWYYCFGLTSNCTLLNHDPAGQFLAQDVRHLGSSGIRAINFQLYTVEPQTGRTI